MNDKLVTSIPLFSGVARRHRASVAALADEVDVAAGTTLTQEGGYARELYAVVDGTAEVRRDGTGVATLGPGDVFGERSVTGTPTRTATVVAATKMRIVVASGRDAASLVDRFPSIREQVHAVAAERAAVPAGA
jgi:CRP/FNR family transcriptional regulator, cyclic AMP receptor protein